MELTRRSMIKGMGILGASTLCLRMPPVFASPDGLRLETVIRSPWMANQVALTGDNVLFLGLPRYARDKATPSLARRGPDGTLTPFPGNDWNTWKPGEDGRNAFVYLNSVHIFADDSLWCVDRGSLPGGIFGERYATPQPGAQKIVQLDAASGDIVQIIRFDEHILPPGAQLNDIRRYGPILYMTDSGLGAIIIHNMTTGKTQRRLSGDPVMLASRARIPTVLEHINGQKAFTPPNSDLIEISDDGAWLFWASPTGPLYKVATSLLNDPDVSDGELSTHVETVFANHFSGGCAMDSLGNIYFSETATGRITLLSPEGQQATLINDPRLQRPDGGFISSDRHLYIPEKTLPARPDPQYAATPFIIYRLALPEDFGGITLGNQIAAL